MEVFEKLDPLSAINTGDLLGVILTGRPDGDGLNEGFALLGTTEEDGILLDGFELVNETDGEMLEGDFVGVTVVVG